tara:strand:- start:212 stop:574 length:363 start_codon:yes stop_codon:yes gene_type:complete
MGEITKLVKEKANILVKDAYNSLTIIPKKHFDCLAHQKARKIAINYVNAIIRQRTNKRDIFWLLVKREIQFMNKETREKQTTKAINLLSDKLTRDYIDGFISLKCFGKQKKILDKELNKL